MQVIPESDMKIAAIGLAAVLLALPLSAQTLDGNAACARVAMQSVPGATITAAQVVASGQLALGAELLDSNTRRALPAFCRVLATLEPSSDSVIQVEVWLPAAGWNGKFQAVGNGGFNGTINYPLLAAALARGYAAASTDTGHAGGGAAWALGHPEKVIDFGWRAVHEMVTASKQLITARYDRAPARSYWNGCSAGGRQGLKAAQRFPEDFDGIIAGSPGLDWTGRAVRASQAAQLLEANSSARLLAADRQLLHRGAVAACDSNDGLVDGLIDRPDRCRFDPGVLACGGAKSGSCLSAAQVDTARLLYSTAVNSKTKRPLPGLLPGSELGWTDLGWSASARATGLDQLRYVVFGDADWNLSRLDFDADVVKAEEAAAAIDALDTNLTPFFARGGKLLQYHGWSDAQISPAASTQYHDRVAAALAGKADLDASYRLFMAPGMGHCRDGEGPNVFDPVDALERWVEHGQPPDRIAAAHVTNGVVDRTRPLCPYPQRAVYTGSGSMDDAMNFACKGP